MTLEELGRQIAGIQCKIRDRVVSACEERRMTTLGSVAADGPGDTIYAIDRVSEEVMVDAFEALAAEVGGIVLIAEGLAYGRLVLPRGSSDTEAAFRVIVDPIDGTRGIMYQKRSAWVLTGVAPNRGHETTLRDVVLSVMTEIPLVKQHLSDQLVAIAEQGVRAERHDRSSGERCPLVFAPSTEESLLHGFASVVRFFPGARDVLSKLDEDLMRALLGPPVPGKALCFEDQYVSTGGQLYELLAGHDRFIADLRPLVIHTLERRGDPAPLCCHPYDVCTALVATELGVIVTSPDGWPLAAPLDLETNVAWVGYANEGLRTRIEPVLQELLATHGLS